MAHTLDDLLAGLGEGALKLRGAREVLEPLIGGLDVPDVRAPDDPEWARRRDLAVVVEARPQAPVDAAGAGPFEALWEALADEVPGWDPREGAGDDARARIVPADPASADRLAGFDALLDEVRREEAASGTVRVRGMVSFEGLRLLLASDAVLGCEPLPAYRLSGVAAGASEPTDGAREGQP